MLGPRMLMRKVYRRLFGWPEEIQRLDEKLDRIVAILGTVRSDEEAISPRLGTIEQNLGRLEKLDSILSAVVDLHSYVLAYRASLEAIGTSLGRLEGLETKATTSEQARSTDYVHALAILGLLLNEQKGLAARIEEDLSFARAAK